MSDKYSIKTVSSIESALQTDWNVLSTSLFTSYEWVKSLEDSKVLDAERYYVLVYHQTRLVAFAMLFVQISEYFPTISEIFLGKKHQSFPIQLNPCLLCYSPLSVIGPGLEIAPDQAGNYAEIIALISAEMQGICERHHIPYYGFLNIGETSLFQKIIQKRYIRAFSCFDVLLPIRWKSFDDYIMSFSSKRRNNVRREIKAYKGEGLANRVDNNFNIDEYAQFINDSDRAGKQTIYRLPVEFYRQLKKNLGDKLYVAEARHQGELRLAALFIEHKEKLFAFKTGQSPKVPPESCGFFVVAVYQVIEHAIKRGLDVIMFGTGTYKYKKYRLAEFSPLYLHLKSIHGWRNIWLKFFLPLAGFLKKRKHNNMIKG